MSIMWEGFHHDKKIPVIIRVEYDEDTKKYTVEVTRGYEDITEDFDPSHEPRDNLMHISDVERSVKIANNLLKKLKRTQITRGKK